MGADGDNLPARASRRYAHHSREVSNYYQWPAACVACSLQANENRPKIYFGLYRSMATIVGRISGICIVVVVCLVKLTVAGLFEVLNV